jgi:hypothetical protein
MWTQLLKIFAVLGRMAAFAFAVIVLALISLTLAQRNWMDGISIFVVVLSCISIIAAWIPPYTNLLYDAFFAAAWLFAAFICFLIMVRNNRLDHGIDVTDFSPSSSSPRATVCKRTFQARRTSLLVRNSKRSLPWASFHSARGLAVSQL